MIFSIEKRFSNFDQSFSVLLSRNTYFVPSKQNFCAIEKLFKGRRHTNWIYFLPFMKNFISQVWEGLCLYLIFEESCVYVNIINYCKIATQCKNMLSLLIHITQLYKQLNDMPIEELWDSLNQFYTKLNLLLLLYWIIDNLKKKIVLCI